MNAEKQKMSFQAEKKHISITVLILKYFFSFLLKKSKFKKDANDLLMMILLCTIKSKTLHYKICTPLENNKQAQVKNNICIYLS